MKRKRLIVRSVSVFMVGLITTLALVIPTSAIMAEYPTEDNNTYADCVMPFNVNFVGTDGSLDYVYSVPVGYNSPVVQTGIQGHETLTGRVLGDGGVTANTASLEYVYYPTEWRIGYDGTEFNDGWGGVPVTLRIDNTDLNGKTIVIEAPTFYVNPLVSNWYNVSNTDTYNRWAMGAFRMPTLSDPTTQAYVGIYSVSANIVDDVGTKHPVSYSKTFDTRVNNNWIPMLEPSLFQDYVINSIQETGYNRIVAVTDFKAYVDYDYYEFVNVIEPSSIDIKVYAKNGNLVHSDGFDLTDSIGLTFSEWASQFSENNYSVNVSNNGVELTYTSGTDTYTGKIYDGINQVSGSTRIAEGVEYGATLNYEEPPGTIDELSGTWVFNSTLTNMGEGNDVQSWSVTFIVGTANYSTLRLTYDDNAFLTRQLRYNTALVYDADYGWYNDAYKTIYIYSKLSEVTNGSTLLTWLKANAMKQGAASLITFTIDGTSYQAESGMTWAQWVESDYNTGDYRLNGIWINKSGDGSKYVGTGASAFVTSSNIIISGGVYTMVFSGEPADVGNSEAPGAFYDDFDWGGALNDEPGASPVDDMSVTTAEGGEWQIVSNSPLKATGIDVSYPVYERNEFADDINLDYPDFNRYITKFRGIGNVDINADFTGWIATATSGFLNFELLPNFSIGGVLAILVGFSLVILFLKIFAGG